MASGLAKIGKNRPMEKIRERVKDEQPSSGLAAIGKKSNDEKNRGGLVGGIGYVAGSLGLGLAGVGEGVLDIATAAADLTRGNTDMAKYRFLDNRVGQAQQRLREDYNPGAVMEFAGDVASGIGQSSVFLLDAVAPGVGTGLFFAGVGGQGISSAAQQTGDVGWRELGYGAASGVTEGLLEKALGAGSKVAGKLGASITRRAGTTIGQKGITTALTKSVSKRAWSSIAKATAKDAAGEFAEEFASEYIDSALLQAFGIDPNASTSFGEAVRAGMVGLFSGGIMGAPGNVINYKTAAKAGRAIRESGETENLLNRAQATVSVLREQEAVKNAEGKKVKKTDEGTEAAEQKGFLVRQGAKREARRAKEYAAKLEKNIKAYRELSEGVRSSEVGDALLGELRGNLYFTNMAYAVEEAEIVLRNVDDDQAQKIVDYINTEAKKAKQEKSDYTVEDFRLNRDGILSQFAAKGRMEQLINGEWTEAEEMAAQAAEATESPVEDAGAAGAVTGEEVGAPEQTAPGEESEGAEGDPWESVEGVKGFGTQNKQEEALLRAAASHGVPKRTVPAMLNSFREGTDMTPAEFADAWADGVMLFGRLGLNEATINEESGLARMSEKARKASIREGRVIADEETKRAQDKSEKKKLPARNKADAKRLQEGRGTIIKGKGLIVKDLSSEQYSAYKAAEVFTSVLGTDIVIETDIKTEGGKRINGYYDTATNTIHINISANRSGQSIALYTLGHEVTHYIKEWSPEKFRALSDFVMEHLGKDASSMISAKADFLRQMPDYKDYTVTQLNDLAAEEVVADGMELILTDGRVLDELAKTDKSLWEKVRDWIKNTVAKIRKYYGELNQASKTAQVLKETMDSLDDIEQLFYEGVTEAGERTRTAEAGVIIDESSGTAMFSIDDIPKNQDEVDAAVNRLVARLGVDETRARQWVQNEMSLATLILRDDMVDYAHRKADRRLTAIVKNSDYKQGTLDFSNICRKRREYTRMMQRIQQAFPNRRFTAEEFATIRKIMVDEGLEVACGLCYVEDRRQNEGYIAETFREAVKSWRAGNRESFYDTKNEEDKSYNKGQTNAMNLIEKGDYLPTIADLTTVEGMEKLQREHPDILRAWRGFNNARGMASARLLTGEAEYQRQILKYNKARVKQINDLGGLRIFSFSDFEEFHLLDIIQAVQDCAAMGIKIQFYTKVPSFALLMKDTKAKGNLSLIPKGDLGYEIKNGKPVLAYDPVEGIDFNDSAFKKVVRGNPNIGTILVGVNDTQIRAAMEDDYIDYIIPFHTGQSAIVRQIKKIGKWENYKDSQTDKKLDTDSKAKPVNVYTDVIAAAEREGDPIRNERQFVERFLKVCKERGLKPRFEQFLKKNEAGEYVYTKGYYKLLLDFKMFDKDGTYLPQEPVIPEFDADLLHELTEKYVAGEKAKTEAESPAFNRALKRVTEEVVGNDDGIRYSIDETAENADVSENRDLTDRELLGMALEGAVQSQEEFDIIKSYREQASMLELVKEKRNGYSKEAAALEKQIKDLRARMDEEGDPNGFIRKAMDEAIIKKREAEKMRDEQASILDDSTRELLRLKAAKPFRELLTREQKRVRAAERRAERAEEVAERRVERARDSADKRVERAKAEYEAREEYKADRREMSVRERVARRVIGRLNTMFYSPSRTKHVPADLQALVEQVLRSEKLDTFKDTRKNLRQMAELERDIEKLEQNPARTSSEQERLDKLLYKYAMLEDEGLDAKGQAEALYTAFKTWMESRPEGQQDKALLDKLSSEIDKMQEMPLSLMSKKSLEAVEDFYKMIYHQVNTANQIYTTERVLYVDDLGGKASQEAQDTKSLKFLSPKAMEIKGKDSIRRFFWKNMKPLTVFEAIGSKTFTGLFQAVLDGEGVWAKDILEARAKIVAAREAHKYKDWDLEKRVEVKTKEGTVKLSLSERMSLYAYAKRAQAVSHLEGGGFVLDPRATTKEGKSLAGIDLERRLNDSTRYVLNEALMGDIASTLTAEQKAYVDEMQTYLTQLGKKGNEVSRKLYGMEIFREDFYFPIKVKSEYLASQTGKTGDPNIKNRGMTKEVVPEAKDPLVLQGFDEVMADHINSMATYHAFVLPVEDLTRVLNYKPANYLRDEKGEVILDDKGKPKADPDAAKDYSTLKAVIEDKYGADAVKYIEQVIRDLNGGARRDAAAGILDRGLTAFKRASTMASLSVLVQQPTSLIRAAAYIEPKYLFGNATIIDFKNHKELWERVKKYAPVAVIKEMGGYDTGVGTRTADYLNATEYGKGERLKGFVKDENYRAEIFGKGAAYADEMAWIQMFEACVSEQADKLGKSRDSEEVLQAAGKRFEEVIRHTQVYDSTLTRSENMRSKDTGMKMATAFMAEPTTIVSMVAEAVMKAERGDKAFLRNTAAAVAGSIILNSIAASLVYALRDDDEDETYGEKYVSTLVMEVADGFNPLGYLPVARDVVSLMQGYEVERTDMALIGNLIDQVNMITSSKRSVSDKVFGVSGAVSAFFGVPVTNLYRDAKGAINTVLNATSPEATTKAGVSAAVKKEFNTIFGLFDEQTRNGYQLYKAYVDGDTAHYNRVAARYENQSAAELALRKELRENDRRIAEAAQAKLEGDLESYEAIVERITGEGIFDRSMVVRAVNNEVSALKQDAEKGNTVPKAETEEEIPDEALYTATDLNAAIDRGDRADFTDVYEYLLAWHVDGGKTEARARSSIKSSVTSFWKKRYLAAWQSNDTKEIKRIQEALTATGLYGSRNEVAKMGQEWVKAYAATR